MTANPRKNNTRQQQTMTHIRRSPLVTKERPNDGNKTTITRQSNVECDRCEKWPKRRSSTNTKRGGTESGQMRRSRKKNLCRTYHRRKKREDNKPTYRVTSPLTQKKQAGHSEIRNNGTRSPPPKNSNLLDGGSSTVEINIQKVRSKVVVSK